jgi:hypothetical protein
MSTYLESKRTGAVLQHRVGGLHGSPCDDYWRPLQEALKCALMYVTTLVPAMAVPHATFCRVIEGLANEKRVRCRRLESLSRSWPCLHRAVLREVGVCSAGSAGEMVADQAVTCRNGSGGGRGARRRIRESEPEPEENKEKEKYSV